MADFKQVALNNMQRQYGYTNISDLMMRKAEVWNKNFGNFSEKFCSEILNIDTCVTSALDYFWGRLFRITRSFEDNGVQFVLDDDTFRRIIKIRAFGMHWDGSITEMNKFLADCFKDKGRCYMLDPQNMTVEAVVFMFQLTDEEKYLFTQTNIFPRPAGVGIQIYEINPDETIGFTDTGFQTFNNGTLWGGHIIWNS